MLAGHGGGKVFIDTDDSTVKKSYNIHHLTVLLVKAGSDTTSL